MGLASPPEGHHANPRGYPFRIVASRQSLWCIGLWRIPLFLALPLIMRKCCETGSKNHAARKELGIFRFSELGPVQQLPVILGTLSATSCYSIFLRYICLLRGVGVPHVPRIAVELGPGSSLGTPGSLR